MPLNDDEQRYLDSILSDFESDMQLHFGDVKATDVTDDQLESFFNASDNAKRLAKLNDIVQTLIDSYKTNVALVSEGTRKYAKEMHDALAKLEERYIDLITAAKSALDNNLDTYDSVSLQVEDAKNLNESIDGKLNAFNKQIARQSKEAGDQRKSVKMRMAKMLDVPENVQKLAAKLDSLEGLIAEQTGFAQRHESDYNHKGKPFFASRVRK